MIASHGFAWCADIRTPNPFSPPCPSTVNGIKAKIGSKGITVKEIILIITGILVKEKTMEIIMAMKNADDTITRHAHPG
jgi:hypothetical protein